MTTTHEHPDHLPQPHVVAGEGAPPADEEPGTSHWSRLLALAAIVVAVGLFGGWPILVVVLALGACIFLHELGHYLTARWAGMKVTEFFLGVGPRIWSFRRGETEYGVKAIPFVAYVKIIGMNNLDEVDPADEDRTYRQKPYWRRMSVAVAGSAMHFLIAIALIWSLFVFFGRPDPQAWAIEDLTTGEQVEGRIELYDPGLELDGNQELIDAFAAGEGPAQLAGLEPGDQIVAVDGEEMSTFQELSEEIRTRPGDEVELTVERDGETFTTTTTIGTISNADGEQGGFLGVGSEEVVTTLGPVEAVPAAVGEVGAFIAASVDGIRDFFTPHGLSQTFGQLGDSFTAEEPAEPTAPAPDEGAPVSEDAGRAVSVIGAVNLGAQATEADVANLLSFIAIINIFFGVFNLIPLLPFDGGHVAVGTYEKLRELLSGSKERYQADVTKLLPLTYGVVAVVVVLGALLATNDLVDPPSLQ